MNPRSDSKTRHLASINAYHRSFERAHDSAIEIIRQGHNAGPGMVLTKLSACTKALNILSNKPRDATHVQGYFLVGFYVGKIKECQQIISKHIKQDPTLQGKEGIQLMEKAMFALVAASRLDTCYVAEIEDVHGHLEWLVQVEKHVLTGGLRAA